MTSARIFNIQKCSIHDGDGLRTLVFFKGCPLRCKWCANPESQSFDKVIMESFTRCIGCGTCREVCPKNAISLDDDFRIDREKCNLCGKCVEDCYAQAKYFMGQKYTVDEVFDEIKKDIRFYYNSTGGVTFSGGEPLCQPEFLYEISRKCKEYDINVAIETCGCGDYDKFKRALKYISSIFFDIKHIDPDIHKSLTGKNNKMILNNLAKIDAHNIPITIRTPVIPDYNDDANNIKAIAEYIKNFHSIVCYELLAYHNLGEIKYKALGRKYELHNVVKPDEHKMNKLVSEANSVLKGSNIVCIYNN